MMAKREQITIEAAGREVTFSNPGKVFFPEAGHTKLDLAKYYLAVADAACRHLRDRPTTLKRFVGGAAGDFFFQKRVPQGAPKWLQTTTVRFPSGRSRRYSPASNRPNSTPTPTAAAPAASTPGTPGSQPHSRNRPNTISNTGTWTRYSP